MDVLSLQALPAEAQEWLETQFDLTVAPEWVNDEASFLPRLAKTRALIIPRQYPIGARVMDAAPKLQCLAHLAGGTENIDLYAAKARDIQVINPLSVVVRSDAEFMLAALLLSVRRGVVTRLIQREQAPDPEMGRELYESTVLMIGLSPVANVLAPILKALGVRLIGYDAAVGENSPLWEKLGIQFVPLAHGLREAQAVTLHMGFAPRYEGLLGERVLANCSRGQTWVCTTRSGIFDRDALAVALNDGRIRTLAMDSPEIDFIAEGSPLRGLRNLIVTPRLARHTHQAQDRAVWYVVHRITDLLSRPALTVPPDDL
jgi:phosphoglycerate dehydrogenase-like enzyme